MCWGTSGRGLIALAGEIKKEEREKEDRMKTPAEKIERLKRICARAKEHFETVTVPNQIKLELDILNRYEQKAKDE